MTESKPLEKRLRYLVKLELVRFFSIMSGNSIFTMHPWR